MGEPAPLGRGKQFQREVQAAFADPEPGSSLTIFEHAFVHKSRAGRVDIILREDGELLGALEIKATNWDRIKPKNVTKNLWSHQHQLMRYIDNFLDAEKESVSPGIIYPKPPRDDALRKKIETYMEDRGIPVYWFSELGLG